VKTRAIQFRCEGRPEWFAIIHPSTIEIGRWQVSYFDDRGAIGDTRRDTLGEALRAIEPGYRIERRTSC
jgi:hypothetical protein